MLDRANLLELMKTAANASPSAKFYSYNGENFSYEALNETVCNELNELVGTIDQYEENHRKAFSLVEEVLDEVVPERLINAYGSFAEIKTYPQSTTPVFRRRMGAIRAKQFITRAGLAGRYETFKLGEEAFEVKTSAIGTAVRVSYEELLDGRVNLAELTQIVMEGMNELIYEEIAAALMGAINQLPAANRVTVAGWDEGGMDHLISTASAYGRPVIYCTREFAVKMIPENGWVSDGMKDDLWYKGMLGSFHGCPVVVLPQTVTDESNSRKAIDPGYVWVIPAGANVKPVKVAFEGTTHMRDVQNNDDWSHDLQIYRKVGVGVTMTTNIFSYVDTELVGQFDNTYIPGASVSADPIDSLSIAVSTSGTISGDTATAGGTLSYYLVNSSKASVINNWTVDTTSSEAASDIGASTITKRTMTASDNGKYLVVVEIKDGKVVAAGQSSAIAVS